MTTRTRHEPLNGVDTQALLSTVDAVKATPSLAAFQFRAVNRWVTGTHSRSEIRGFYGAGREDVTRFEDFVCEADHPAVLVGTGKAPTPVEFLLHALAACLTAGLVNVAAVRGVKLTEVEASVEGDIDLRGILGLSEEVRNGYQGLRVGFRIRGDAPEEVLRGLVERSRSRSAVYDVLTTGVPVEIDVTTG
ncbi:OsmC family protein [Actinocorallia longicatena]|uniref:OsmC family protein n=1 Tax=Actinocorallia longicatena TaxID=111803 RepID=A0ABP6PXB4_9ACTN